MQFLAKMVIIWICTKTQLAHIFRSFLPEKLDYSYQQFELNFQSSRLSGMRFQHHFGREIVFIITTIINSPESLEIVQFPSACELQSISPRSHLVACGSSLGQPISNQLQSFFPFLMVFRSGLSWWGPKIFILARWPSAFKPKNLNRMNNLRLSGVSFI